MNKYDFTELTGLRQWMQLTGWFDLEEAIAIQSAVKQLPPGSRIAELGSFQGKSSVAIASVMPADSILYCVDMFRGTIIRPGEKKPPIEEIVKKNLDAITKNLEAFGVKDKVRVLVMSTNEAAGKFEGEYFDLVFIDADHSYEGVKADLLNWYPKLKPGGFLFCDDYGMPEFPGVAQAVQTVGLQGQVVAPSLWAHRKPASPAVNTEAMPEII